MTNPVLLVHDHRLVREGIKALIEPGQWIITSEIDVIEYRTISAQGAHILKKMPGNRKPPTIVLKRGKDEDSQKRSPFRSGCISGRSGRPSGGETRSRPVLIGYLAVM